MEYLNALEKDISHLQEANERMMMVIHSADAACHIQDEIREIINCPYGYSIIDAVKQLKAKQSNE